MVLTKTKRETLELVFLCLSLSLLFLFTEADDKPSAYQALQDYNLPIGLLPVGVLGYTLDPDIGEFSVDLNSSCNVHAGDYKVKFSSPITGVISQNNLGKIGGVKVKIALFWFNIVNVKRNQDRLVFSIAGLVPKHFPVNDFNSCPKCN